MWAANPGYPPVPSHTINSREPWKVSPNCQTYLSALCGQTHTDDFAFSDVAPDSRPQ